MHRQRLLVRQQLHRLVFMYPMERHQLRDLHYGPPRLHMEHGRWGQVQRRLAFMHLIFAIVMHADRLQLVSCMYRRTFMYIFSLRAVQQHERLLVGRHRLVRRVGQLRLYVANILHCI